MSKLGTVRLGLVLVVVLSWTAVFVGAAKESKATASDTMSSGALS